MKKVLVFASFVFAASVCAASAAPASVIDCYNEIPSSFFYGAKYELRRSGKKWLTASTADAEIEALVDIANGYIRIEDPGTGGGTRVDEVALFISKSGAVIIGINRKDIDGVVGTSSSLLFVSKEGGRWADVTQKVLPKTGLSSFFKPGFKPSDKVTILSWFELPRRGTTVVWNLDTVGVEARIGCEQNVAENKAVLANIKTKRIEFLYDAKTGTFTVK